MYIAIHSDAERKPKAIRTAALLGMQPRQFIFHVMAPVWMFAAENHDGSGEVTGLDDAILSNITFGACRSVTTLVEAGWLQEVDGRLLVPRWDEHEPFFIKRYRDREAQRTKRAEERRRNDIAAMSARHRTDISTTSQIEERRVEEIRVTESNEVKAITAPKVAVTQDALPKAPKTPKAHWSEPQGKQLSLLPDGSPKKVYPFLNKLARQYTQAAVLHALSKSQSETFANWAHATGWLTVVARNSQVTESHVYEDKLDD